MRKVAECVTTGRCEGFSIYLKTLWSAGPWHHEPDRMEFAHSGFNCLLHRGPSGVWCGYVGLRPDHPWYGVRYSGCPISCGQEYCAHSPERRMDVHGGLTYSEECQGHICHQGDGPGEILWWFGFDCGHAWDISPAYEHFALGELAGAGSKYRDLQYARVETERLAVQLAEVHLR